MNHELLTLLEAFQLHATRHPFKPAFVQWSGDSYSILSYGDLWRSSNCFANWLRRHGVERGEVFIILKHNPMLQIGYLGSMLAGAIPSYLPYPTPKQDTIQYWKSHEELINRINPTAIITYSTLVEPIGSICSKNTLILNIADLDHAASTFSIDRPIFPGNDCPALLQHSSGTTGLKKGVLLTFRQISAQVHAYAPTIGLTDTSIVVSWLPLYHDMGLFTALIIPISIGATVVAIDAFEWVKRPALLLELIELFRGTHIFMPNFAFNHIVNSVPPEVTYDLSSVQSFVSCSEPVKYSTFEKFFQRFESSGFDRAKLQACYAMAETCFAVSQSKIGEPYRVVDHSTIEKRNPTSFVSNGRVISGVEIRLLADDGTFIPEPAVNGGAVGEIAIRGTFLFSSYNQNPEATAAAFVDGWYRSGDVGFFDAGELFVCGRKKEIVIVHGRNYYLHDIEEIVSQVPHVVPGRAVAIGVSEEEGEELLILIETSAPPVTYKEMKRQVKRAVFNLLELTPKYVEFFAPGSLRKTTSGKISRVENLVLFQNRVREVGVLSNRGPSDHSRDSKLAFD